MTTIADDTDELVRLRALEREHRLALRVLAVAIEQLLRATDSEQIVISPAALSAARTLSAWRDKQSNGFVLTVAP
jgi:hypothetical protein